MQVGSTHTHWNHDGVALHYKGYKLRRFMGHPRGDKSSFVLEHILIAEWVLGRSLKDEEQVHHVDEDKGNNSPSNLVICPDAAYHKLLHRRAAAVQAGFPARYRRCKFCKDYDAPPSLGWWSGSHKFALSQLLCSTVPEAQGMKGPPISLVERRKQRGDLDPIALLKALLKELEEGTIPMPKILLLACLLPSPAGSDAVELSVRMAGGNNLEAVGLCEYAKRYIECCATDPEPISS